MFLFDHRSLPQAGQVRGHAAPYALQDFEHLRSLIRSSTSSDKRQSYAERQEHREAEINGLKRSFEILESEGFEKLAPRHVHIASLDCKSMIVAEVNKD